MSMYDPNAPFQNPGSAGNQDVVIQLQGIVNQLSALVAAFQGRFTFGTFTFAAAATTVVPNTAVRSNSVIVYTPTNAAAGTLIGSAKSVYTSAISSGTSFTAATASAVAAAGTETFSYAIMTPQ